MRFLARDQVDHPDRAIGVVHNSLPAVRSSGHGPTVAAKLDAIHFTEELAALRFPNPEISVKLLASYRGSADDKLAAGHEAGELYLVRWSPVQTDLLSGG